MCTRDLNLALSGEETFLVTVDWEDNWPIFNSGKSINLVTISHSDKLKEVLSFVWSSDFSQPELERGWYQPCKLSRIAQYGLECWVHL
jgi:beta-xylosidase